MPSENHFDVIIIGTGAGGGTLAYHLAPSGKRILLWNGQIPARRRTIGLRSRLSGIEVPSQGTWYDKDGNTFHPGIQYYVAGIPRFTARRCCGFARRILGRSGTMAVSRPPGHSTMLTLSLLHESRGSVSRPWKHGIDPTEGPASAPYRYPPVSHEPRIQELHDDLQRLAIIPSLCRSVSCSMKRR